jgi:hypothetical protein
MLGLTQATQGRVVPSSFGVSQRSSSFVKDRSSLDEIKDVVRVKPESF